MNVQDIIDRLTVLGLGPQESAVYVHLNMLGASKASDVAAALRLHRTEAYRVLQNLVQQGFATATLSRPIRFEAEPAEKLFGELIRVHETKAENIHRARDEIAASLSNLRSPGQEVAGRNTFKILQGRREAYAVLERLAREAKTEIRLMTTMEAGIPLLGMAGIMDILADRARSGIAVRVLAQLPSQGRSKWQEIDGALRDSIRTFECDRLVQFALADERPLILWTSLDSSTRLSSEHDAAIWTDAGDFCGTLSVFFETAWSHSGPLRRESEPMTMPS